MTEIVVWADLEYMFTTERRSGKGKRIVSIPVKLRNTLIDSKGEKDGLECSSIKAATVKTMDEGNVTDHYTLFFSLSF